MRIMGNIEDMDVYVGRNRGFPLNSQNKKQTHTLEPADFACSHFVAISLSRRSFFVTLYLF